MQMGGQDSEMLQRHANGPMGAFVGELRYHTIEGEGGTTEPGTGNICTCKSVGVDYVVTATLLIDLVVVQPLLKNIVNHHS